MLHNTLCHFLYSDTMQPDFLVADWLSFQASKKFSFVLNFTLILHAVFELMKMHMTLLYAFSATWSFYSLSVISKMNL